MKNLYKNTVSAVYHVPKH